MPYPTVSDDGSIVILDLHGARVDEAVALTRSLIEEAARRGRSQIRVVHGSSTTLGDGQRRTIKRELYHLLDTGALERYITATFRQDDALTLSLDVTRSADPARISITDLR